MKALILAGGRGTRLRPITHTLNKHLIPLAGKPMLTHVIENVIKIGIHDIIINLNAGDQEIPKLFGDGQQYGCQIQYIEQKTPNGMMYPILLARSLLSNDPFVLIAGDNVLSGGLERYYDEFINNGSSAHLLVTRVKDPSRFGVAVVHNGRLIKTIEKPKEFVSDLAVTGIYFYRTPIFQAMENAQPEVRGQSTIAEYYPPPAHQWLVDHGFTVTVSEVTGWWKDTGHPSDILEGNQLLMRDLKEENHATKSDDSALIQGVVNIGSGTQILGKTLLRGPLCIGKNCVIANSYIGPFTSVSDNVTITDTEIENSIILDYSNIHSSKRIIDSIIGSYATITDRGNTLPQGHKLIIGDHGRVEL